MRVSDSGDRLSNIIRALANRLTADDNWGPEGKKGQVLTSNGDRPTDPPPSFQDIQSVISGAAGQQGEQGLQGPPGPAGLAGADGASGMIPLVIAAGETFVVPENKQATYSVVIDIEGILDIEGVLALVD